MCWIFGLSFEPSEMKEQSDSLIVVVIFWEAYLFSIAAGLNRQNRDGCIGHERTIFIYIEKVSNPDVMSVVLSYLVR